MLNKYLYIRADNTLPNFRLGVTCRVDKNNSRLPVSVSGID